MLEVLDFSVLARSRSPAPDTFDESPVDFPDQTFKIV